MHNRCKNDVYHTRCYSFYILQKTRLLRDGWNNFYIWNCIFMIFICVWIMSYDTC